MQQLSFQYAKKAKRLSRSLNFKTISMQNFLIITFVPFLFKIYLMLYFPLYYLLFFLLLRQYTLHKIVLLLIRGHLTQMPSTKIMAMYSKGPVNFAGPLTYQRSTNSLQFLSIIQTPKRLCVDLKCSPGNQVWSPLQFVVMVRITEIYYPSIHQSIHVVCSLLSGQWCVECRCGNVGLEITKFSACQNCQQHHQHLPNTFREFKRGVQRKKGSQKQRSTGWITICTFAIAASSQKQFFY